MLVYKIFHLRQPIPEARERLREPRTWNSPEHDPQIKCSTVDPKGVGHVELDTHQGDPISADIEEVPGDDPNRILFRSIGGDLDLAGIFELYPIRPNLTEVVLTLEYESASPLQKAFEAVDRFLNRHLARLEACVARA